MRKKISYVYISSFSKEFSEFLQYRISAGSDGIEERYVLKLLDKHLTELGITQKRLDGPIIDSWVNSLSVGSNTKSHYVSVYRQLAYYLTGLGFDAYIPAPLYAKRDYTPYIFTHDEIKRLFHACDNILPARTLTNVQLWLPVMVRLLYGCGLRVGEAVSIQNQDIDWSQGTLLIRSAKGNKDRIVPMSSSLVNVCRAYYEIAHPTPDLEDYFFYNHRHQPLSRLTPYIWFRRALEAAGLEHKPYPEQSRGVGVHCLRHTFAVHTLQKQHERNIDRFYSVPILSTYMGHKDIYGTELYLRLTPESYELMIDRAEKYTREIFSGVSI